MSDSNTAEFEKILVDFDPSIQDLARQARALVFDVLPQTVEVVWPRQRNAGYGTGPKKMSEHFCWIAPAKQHVSLGFYYGAELPDPEKLLEGTGKLMRHVKIRIVEDLQCPALRDLIEVATTHRVPPPKAR